MSGKIFLIFAISCIVVLISGNSFAYTKIFLHQKSENSGDNIKLSDVASVDSDDESKIGDIIIPGELLTDNLVDKSELYSLIKENTTEPFFIYGNAVRVEKSTIFPETNESTDNVASVLSENYLIKKGDNIKFIIKKNLLSIEVNAVAMSSGKFNEEITVKLKMKSGKNSRVEKGRIKSNDTVEALI